MTTGWRDALAEPARDLGLDPAAAVTITGSTTWLPSPLPVFDSAIASVAAALLAASDLHASSQPAAVAPRVELATDQVAAAFRSEVYVTVDGQSLGAGFAPLSRFWPTADGVIRTHANYPWHRAALLRALAASDDAGVGPALLTGTAVEAEAAIVGAGGVAAAVRSEETWRTSPPGRAAGVRPLIDIEAIGDASPRPPAPAATAHQPAAGLRVLDLTRVIAGPVATRMLAALGADVLRIDPPDRPELPLHAVDGVQGKTSALLDLETDAGRRSFNALVAQADVVVCGYRPGSLDRYGLHPRALAYRHPGVVFASVSAWGTTGPWGGERGFDSLVQAASGIALLSSGDGVTPGALPCQLLDHGSGYLAAAGIVRAVARQRTDGGTFGVWISLARTAAWLLGQPRPDVAGQPTRQLDPAPWFVDLPGGVTAIGPPGKLDGHQLGWSARGGRYGADAPRW